MIFAHKFCQHLFCTLWSYCGKTFWPTYGLSWFKVPKTTVFESKVHWLSNGIRKWPTLLHPSKRAPLLPCVLRFFLLSKKCQNPTVHYAVCLEAKLKTEDKKDPRYYLKIVQRIKRIVVKIWLKKLNWRQKTIGNI